MRRLNRDSLRAWLKVEEGLRLKPYTDTVGKLTIGYGRNLTDVGISLAEAEALLEADIAQVEGVLSGALGQWYDELDEVRQEVLADMCFNLGITKLLKFKRTLGLVKVGAYAAAATAMLQSRWAEQVGGRANRLSEAMATGLMDLPA